MILLDTDVMVDILRQYPPAIAWLETLNDEGILLPGFVIMELIQGSRNKEEQEKLELVLKNYPVVWPSGAMCNEALSVFARHHLSHGIGVLDALIGQIAVARDFLCIPSTKNITKPFLAYRLFSPTARTYSQVAWIERSGIRGIRAYASGCSSVGKPTKNPGPVLSAPGRLCGD